MIVKHDHELEALKSRPNCRFGKRRNEKPSETRHVYKKLDLIGKKILEEHGANSAPEKNMISRYDLHQCQ